MPGRFTGAHTDVLIANSRVDQGRIRAAVEASSTPIRPLAPYSSRALTP